MPGSIFDQFVRKWVHTHYETTPASQAELDQCEAALGYRFPQSYVDAVREHGAPSVDIRLLGVIADGDAPLDFDMGDVQEFIALADIPPVTPDNYMGLPDGYIPFASDCAGNPLCFARADSEATRPKDAPVWKWDHDLQDFSASIPSFTSLIKAWTALDYPTTEQLLAEEWETDIGDIDGDSASIWKDVVRRHSESHRRYHGLEHLQALKKLMWSHAHPAGVYARTPPHLAIWWHDAVYDPKARDNEQRSADLARQHLTQLRVAPAIIDETCRLILMTRNHWDGPSAGAGDYFLDADIAILGARQDLYDAYAAAVRQEYAWADDAAYRAGRSAFLNSAIARPRLFRTTALETAYAAQARTNMQRELASLG